MEIRVRNNSVKTRVNKIAEEVIQMAQENAEKGIIEFTFTKSDWNRQTDWEVKWIVEEKTNGTVYQRHMNSSLDNGIIFCIKKEGE